MTIDLSTSVHGGLRWHCATYGIVWRYGATEEAAVDSLHRALLALGYAPSQLGAMRIVRGGQP
jgi:hypothetical protein